jgi:hypothetical protein
MMLRDSGINGTVEGRLEAIQDFIETYTEYLQ